MTPRKLYNFLIDPDLAEKLKQVKALEGVPESEVIRRALREYFASREADEDAHMARLMNANRLVRRALAEGATEADYQAVRLAKREIDEFFHWRNREIAVERMRLRSAKLIEPYQKALGQDTEKRPARKRAGTRKRA
jgi:hypothetical protein